MRRIDRSFARVLDPSLDRARPLDRPEAGPDAPGDRRLQAKGRRMNCSRNRADEFCACPVRPLARLQPIAAAMRPAAWSIWTFQREEFS